MVEVSLLSLRTKCLNVNQPSSFPTHTHKLYSIQQVSISDVKKKWHCLRTAYANELKREKQSLINPQRSPFKSNLFYFKDMEFITEHIVFRKNFVRSFSELEFADDSGTETYNSLSPENFASPSIPDIENLGALEEIYPDLDNFLEREFDDISRIDESVKMADTTQPPITVDVELDNSTENLMSIPLSCEDTNQEYENSPTRKTKVLVYQSAEAKRKDFDEYETFAMSLASQMRRMEFEDAMTVMAQIQQIVCTKRIERERKRWVVVC